MKSAAIVGSFVAELVTAEGHNFEKMSSLDGVQ
jgi:hypothetical protein